MHENTTERWWAAVCYLSAIVVLPSLLVKPKSAFLARHCRQGFALFFSEFVLLIALAVIDGTIGHIPVLGLLISILLHLIVLLVALGVSVLGFVRALSGETWTILFLDDLADRVPIQES